MKKKFDHNKSPYYSDVEVEEILWICRAACRDALAQIRKHLKEGVRFDEVMGRSRAMYGEAAAGIRFAFRAAPATAEVVNEAEQIEEGGNAQV